MARITVVNDHPDFLETMYAILEGEHGHVVRYEATRVMTDTHHLLLQASTTLSMIC